MSSRPTEDYPHEAYDEHYYDGLVAEADRASASNLVMKSPLILANC